MTDLLNLNIDNFGVCKMNMIVTKDNVQRLVWYGEPKVRYFTWEDGQYGVNYEVDGMLSIDGFYCSKEEFLEMANRGKPNETCEDLYFRALALGWEVEPASLFDEEGVEGWTWTSPDGYEESVVREWNETPPLPMSLYLELTKETENG